MTNGEIPNLPTLKHELIGRAAELEAQSRPGNPWSVLLERLEYGAGDDWQVSDAGLTDEQQRRVNKLVYEPTSTEEKLLRSRARNIATRLLSPSPVDFSDVIDELPGDTPEEREESLTIMLVAGITSHMESEEAQLNRFALQSEMQTLTYAEDIMERRTNSVLRAIPDVEAINPEDPTTWLDYPQLKERFAEAYVEGLTDPRGYPQMVSQVLKTSERTRIFIPDQLGIAPDAIQKLDATFKALKVQTGADSSAFQQAIHADLEGPEMRAIISGLRLHPVVMQGEVERNDKGIYVVKEGTEETHKLHTGTAEALDFIAGNKVEFAETEPGKYVLKAEEDINNEDGDTVVNQGDTFTLFDDQIGEYIRERVLSGDVMANPTYPSGKDPRRPERIIPGEWLLTMPAIFKIYDGSSPLRTQYLESANLNPDKPIVGFHGSSGLRTENHAVLQWQDHLMLGVDPQTRSDLIEIDSLSIRQGAFFNYALQLHAVTQYDAFFDPAARAKQHLETSMRTVIPREYQHRHEIQDQVLRDTALSLFSALQGRKLNLNAYIVALSQGKEKAKNGYLPNHKRKRIDDMTDPWQLTGEDNFLGLIELDPDSYEEQARILDYYSVSRREYLGKAIDGFTANKLYFEARNLKEQLEQGSINQDQFSQRLEALKREIIEEKKRDYIGEAENGYYWNKRSYFKIIRPAVEQAAMLHAMTPEERQAIATVSHKDLIVSLGGPDNLPDWAYKGWYGKMMAIKYTASMEFFDYGGDWKALFSQLKYAGKAGENFAQAMAVQQAAVQALDPDLLAEAGMDVGPAPWGDEAGERIGAEIANRILHSIVPGGKTVAEFFEKLAEATVGYAKTLPWMTADHARDEMRMFILYLTKVIEGGIDFHYRKMNGLGGSGTSGEMLRLDPNDPNYGEVNQWLISTYREIGMQAVFPEGEAPYVNLPGTKVAYSHEGSINQQGKWVEGTEDKKPLHSRYEQKDLILFQDRFQRRLTFQILEMFLRDSQVFDKADKEWVRKQIENIKNKK